jgi:hypothetical protein
MSKHQVEQPEILSRPVSAIVAAGHQIRMCLDPDGHFFALFCITCDPTMAEGFQTRH